MKIVCTSRPQHTVFSKELYPEGALKGRADAVKAAVGGL